MAGLETMPSEEAWSFAIDPGSAGMRLDKLLCSRIPALGRARARVLFESGLVAVIVEGRRRRAKKGERAEVGTTLFVSISAADLGLAAVPDPTVSLDLAFHNAHVVVVDKPAGMPSAPLKARETGTVAGGLLALYPEMAEVGYAPREPGLCHRLDTGTSGLLVAARSHGAFQAMTTALRGGALDKRYLLVAPGDVLPDRGVIERALAPDPADRRRVTWGEAAEGAPVRRTRYQVRARDGGLALVEARASPAYRHQIRAHFASIGAPLLGDAVYRGPEVAGLGRHALHASRIVYGGGPIPGFDVQSALPDDLVGLVRASSSELAEGERPG